MPLCTLTVRGGDATGETNLTIISTKIDDDVGGRYAPEITDAILVVENLPRITSVSMPVMHRTIFMQIGNDQRGKNNRK